MRNASLACARGHSFDMARQGSVNLLAGSDGAHGDAAYDRSSFLKRRIVLEAGLYDHVSRAVVDAVASVQGELVLDAGCGEGHFARRVAEAVGADVVAVDLSKDSVRLAAGADAFARVGWIVADLAHLPLRDDVASCILNVFSPANYAEFRRVLAPGGIVVKVVPTPDHLREVRRRAAGALAHDAYSNDRVVDRFGGAFSLLSRTSVSATCDLSADVRDALIGCTPLLAHADAAGIDWADLERVTISADVLVGR